MFKTNKSKSGIEKFLAEKRMVFFAGKKTGAEGPEVAKGKEKGPEIPEAEIEKRKKEGIKYTGDLLTTLRQLADKVYAEDKTKADENYRIWQTSYTDDFLVQYYVKTALESKSPNKDFSKKLTESGITNVSIRKKDGKEIMFFNEKEGINIDKGILINEPPKPAEATKAEAPAGAAEAKETTPEKTPEQESLNSFKKAFPNLKRGQYRVSGTETIAPGTTAEIPFTRYQGETPVLYRTSGTKYGLTEDATGARSAEATEVQPIVIEAPNEQGILSRYVYVTAKVEGAMVKETFKGWIELGRLRQGETPLKTVSEWDNIPVKTEMSIEKGPRTTLDAAILHYRGSKKEGKTVERGLAISQLEKGENVNVVTGNVYKVGSENYVLVEATKGGVKETGWVRLDLIETTKEELPASTEVAYEKTVVDERARQDMVAKYYNRDTGRIDFGKDKAAEMAITLQDLFPNAKQGDLIRIKRGANKSMLATYNAGKEYKVFRNSKWETITGGFFYKNGVRATILNGDVIMPEWEKEGEIKKPDRPYKDIVQLKEGQTYNDLLNQALTYPDIKAVFDASTLAPAEKVNTYINLLKKYQQGNTVFLIVPAPEEEMAVVTEAEKYGEALSARADKYKQNYETNLKKQRDYTKGRIDHYIKEQTFLKEDLKKVADDDELWNKAWNGEKTEIEGIDHLMEVLKDPFFVEAGITRENARQKVLDLIQEGRNDRVDLEDIINVFEIYHKEGDGPGKYKDFNDEIDENNKAMQENLSGYTAFRQKWDQVKANTEIIDTGKQKMELAKSRGLKQDALMTGEESRKYEQAYQIMEDIKKDPNYKKHGDYRHAAYRNAYLTEIVMVSGNLLDSIGSLGLKEFKAGAEAPMTQDTKNTVKFLGEVFADSQETKIAWEDVLAGKEHDPKELTYFGSHFDQNAPVLRLRSRLNKYTDENGNLTGVESIDKQATVNELNRLLEKGLERLGVSLGKRAKELLEKYADPSVSRSDNAAMLKSTYEKLKINNFKDLQTADNSTEDFKLLVRDRKNMIKLGYYFDERDREMGIVEKTEAPPSDSPMATQIMKRLAAEGYPAEKMPAAEQKILGAISAHFGTQHGFEGATITPLIVPLDGGWYVGLTLGIFNVETNAAGDRATVPMLGVTIRKEWKVGEEKDQTVGVNATPLAFFGGAGAGVGIMASGDYRFPVSDATDLSLLLGGGYMTHGAFGAVGLGVHANVERDVKKTEEKIMGAEQDTVKKLEIIDAESDPDKKYALIIQTPLLKQLFADAIVSRPGLDEEQKKVIVLDCYKMMRNELKARAIMTVQEEGTPGFAVPILHQIMQIFGGEFKITDIAIAVGISTTGPIIGGGLGIELANKFVLYQRPSVESKTAREVSSAESRSMLESELKKRYPNASIEIKKMDLGWSPDVFVDPEGNVSIKRSENKIDLRGFELTPDLSKFNEALKPYDMQFVPDKERGLFELQVFGALGNTFLYMDPGIADRGLIMDGNKIYLAPGKKPELFITREEFYTPYPERGSTMNTLITFTDTPKRSRAEIQGEIASMNSPYLYRKQGMNWEVMGRTEPGTNVTTAQYAANRFERYTESKEGQGLDQGQFNGYVNNVNQLPFIKEAKEDVDQKSLNKFAEDYHKKPANQILYRRLTTVKPEDTIETVDARRKELAGNIQKAAEQDPGLKRQLIDMEMNYVLGKLMDLSFSELEKATDRRARFENNLEWSKKAVLIPFFKKKIEDLNAKGQKITTTAEVLTDYFAKQLMMRVTDADLATQNGKKFDTLWTFNSVAGTMGFTGLRGLPSYMQDRYGVLGYNTLETTKPGPEGDLAKVILELMSPLDTKNDKEFMNSILAKKIIGMPGLWVVLGNDMANQAIAGAKEALAGNQVAGNDGFNEFKKIVTGIREAQLRGGNVYTYTNKYGNIFQFRLITEIADGAHARCGNPSFGAREDIVISAQITKDQGILVAAGAEKTATVRSVAALKTYGILAAASVTIESAPPPPPPPGQTPTTTTTTETAGTATGTSDTTGGATTTAPPAPATTTGTPPKSM